MSGDLRESLASPHPLSRRNSWSNPLGLNIFSRGASDTVQLEKGQGAPPDLTWNKPLNSHAFNVKEFNVTFSEALKMVPPIDPFGRDHKPLACHGVPLGGMGGGSIGRGFRGDFRRWQFVPGVCEEAPVLADQFSVFVRRGSTKISSVLYPGRPKELKAKEQNWGIGSWKWNLDGQKSTYHALFPRSWTIYDGEPDPELKISCRQVSPFIPHNYQESSLPSCVFAYTLVNNGREAAEVTLAFTFANSIGGTSMLKGGHHNAPFKEKNGVEGVLLHHKTAKVGAPVTFAIAARETEQVAVSTCPRFSVTGQGGDCTARDMWHELEEFGKFKTVRDPARVSATSYPGTAIGGAVAATVTVPPNEKREVHFSLAWDSPIVKFNRRSSYYRRYTQFYGQDGNAAPKLAHDALLGFKHWEEAIDEWQKPIVGDPALPEWYRVTLFNELYYLVAGGTIWTDGGPRLEERTPQEWGRREVSKRTLGSSIRASDMMAGLPIMEGKKEGLVNGDLGVSFAPKDASAAEHGGDMPPVIIPETEAGGLGGGNAKSRVICAVDAGGMGGLRLSLPQGGRNALVDFDSPARHHPLTPDISLYDKDRIDGTELAFAPEAAPNFSERTPSSSLPHSASESDVQEEGQAVLQPSRAVADSGAYSNMSDYDSGTGSMREGGGNGDRPSWRQCAGVKLLGEEEENVGQFLYLEGLEYVMWNTYDVHFYASFALLALFPQLELSIQRDFAVGTMRNQNKKVRFLMDGRSGKRKVACAVPHDLGNHDPWLHLNSYNIHDTSQWKDLNCKFTLQCYRDVVATGNTSFAKAVWPAVLSAMLYVGQYDRDKDGLIENDGFADQTYDAWAVHGVSAYCGGLWLAALQAAEAYAKLMDDAESGAHFKQLLERGRVAYEKALWTGKYFKYDSGSSSNSQSIQADQMAGQWYTWSSALPPLFGPDKARSALQTVFDFNVMKNGNGRMGAMNGMQPNGKVDESCMQSREVWTGVTYGAAAAMIYEGMLTEAFKTAEGIYIGGWKDFGYWFQTPEAWTAKGHFRSLSYMRPLAIWGMQWALAPPPTIPKAVPPRVTVERGELGNYKILAAFTQSLSGVFQKRPSNRSIVVKPLPCGSKEEVAG